MEKTATSAVLVGGASRRFGSPKQNIVVGAESIVDRTRRILTHVFGHPPMLIGSDDAPDDRANTGPLGGIETALRRAKRSDYESVLVVACDMPGITPEMIRMIANHSSAAYVVAPKVDGNLQPLCARWLTNFLPIVENALNEESLSVKHLLGRYPPYVIEEDELMKRTQSPRQVFANVNTPADLENFRKNSMK